jgi:hypothetical protein
MFFYVICISHNVPSVSDSVPSSVLRPNSPSGNFRYALLYAVATAFIPPFLNNTYGFLSHNYKIIDKLIKMRL